MSQELLRHVHKQSKSLKNKVADIRPGLRVRVHQRIIEGSEDNPKERVQMFEGLVIAVSHGNGVDKTFTVRKIASGVGVEKIFPLHSNRIAKIDVLGKNLVRRSKLYFMRERAGKQARLKETALFEAEAPTEAEALSEEAIQEAVEAAEKAKKEETADAAPETVEEPTVEEPTIEEPIAEAAEEAKEGANDEVPKADKPE